MWIITIISILGSIFNAKKSILCFYIWILSNILWFTCDIYFKFYSRAVLDTLQTALCIYGIIYWKKED